MDGAPSFEEVRARVKQLVEGKIIVGHAIFNDLAVSSSFNCPGDAEVTGSATPTSV